MVGRPPHLGETSVTLRSLVHDVSPSPPPRTSGDGLHTAASSTPCDHGAEDTTPVQQKRLSEPQHVVIDLCHTISYDVNALLLHYALNRLNILLILAGNTDVTLELAVIALKNLELKRDAVQTENDLPAR